MKKDELYMYPSGYSLYFSSTKILTYIISRVTKLKNP